MVLTNGMEITSTQANQAPMVSFESLSSDKDYTVAMVSLLLKEVVCVEF